MFLSKLFLTILSAVAIIHNVESDCSGLEFFGNSFLRSWSEYLTRNLWFSEIGVTAKDAELIVARHNKYRQDIMDGNVPGQPRGVQINLLVILINLKFFFMSWFWYQFFFFFRNGTRNLPAPRNWWQKLARWNMLSSKMVFKKKIFYLTLQNSCQNKWLSLCDDANIFLYIIVYIFF